MKKIIFLGCLVFTFAIATTAMAATPNWDVSGTYKWLVLGMYEHDMEIVMSPNGTFSGTGGYPAGHSPYILSGETPESITNGLVDGDNIIFTTLYAGPYNSGYTVTVSGVINSDGTMSGNSPWEWHSTLGLALNIEDEDEDGVSDIDDICINTVADVADVSLGTNRHVWYQGEYLATLVPAGKNGYKETISSFAIADTYGCSCEQILDRMKSATGFEFGGHYKYGCSKSIIEDWIAGKYYIGPTLLETIVVPANSELGASSVNVLDAEKDYFLKSYGTAMACNQPGCVINFDAEYSTSDPISPWLTWTDGVAAPYTSYGVNLLDLKVDGNFVDWGIYNELHTYQIPYAGTGDNLDLAIYDIAGSYFNDSGSISVDLIEDKWVDLW